MQKETWKDIKGYEGYYAVSNFGRVKSLRSNKIMNATINSRGYPQVNLKVNGNRKCMRVHTLVAETFIPNPENKPQIDHIDTDPTNNHVSNLKWVTMKENMNNSITLERTRKRLDIMHKTINIGNKSNTENRGIKSKLHKKVKCIETGKIYYGTREAAEALGAFYQGANCRISEVCRGISPSYKGFHFEYVED
jgi:hypothetical protein